MASALYNAALTNEANGAINYGSDTFKAMLVDSSYTPDVDAHAYRDDVTGEITGTGYTAGGEALTVAVTQDNANDRASIAFDPVTWETATLTAAGAVIYKSRGGAASADELVAYVDFGGDRSASGGDFMVTFTTPLYKTAA